MLDVMDDASAQHSGKLSADGNDCPACTPVTTTVNYRERTQLARQRPPPEVTPEAETGGKNA